MILEKLTELGRLRDFGGSGGLWLLTEGVDCNVGGALSALGDSVSELVSFMKHICRFIPGNEFKYVFIRV